MRADTHILGGISLD